MCWCRPEVRTPFCGRAGCHPPIQRQEISVVTNDRSLVIYAEELLDLPDGENAEVFVDTIQLKQIIQEWLVSKKPKAPLHSIAVYDKETGEQIGELPLCQDIDCQHQETDHVLIHNNRFDCIHRGCKCVRFRK